MKPSNLSVLKAVGGLIAKVQYPKQQAHGAAKSVTVSDLPQQMELLKFKTAIQEQALVAARGYTKKVKGEFSCTVENCQLSVSGAGAWAGSCFFEIELQEFGNSILRKLKDTSFLKPFKIKV
jgi:hypothetical protein